MASIKKVYRGMQNGAETINDDLEAINSELTSGGNVVHKTGDESVAGNKTFTSEMATADLKVNGRFLTTKSDSFYVGCGLTLSLTKKGNIVEVRFSGTMTSAGSGKPMGGSGAVWVSPDYRPSSAASVIGHFSGTSNSFQIDIGADGEVVWWGETTSGGETPRGTAFYYLN